MEWLVKNTLCSLKASHSPLMLSWVIGSRRMLSPRILLALFVLHLSPFCIRSIVLWGKTVIMCYQVKQLTFDLQLCQDQEGASQSIKLWPSIASYSLSETVAPLPLWTECQLLQSCNNIKIREKPCMSKCLWARKHLQALIPILFYIREKLLWGVFEVAGILSILVAAAEPASYLSSLRLVVNADADEKNGLELVVNSYFDHLHCFI